MLVTTVVGSYPQPDWLIDRESLASRPPPRAAAPELWRVAPEHLEEAQDDATLLALRDMERAGVDLVTDGEMRRASYSSRFANALEGVDPDRPGVFVERSGLENAAPRIVGPLRRRGPVEIRDVEFLRAATDRSIKITVPGPFTLAQQTHDEHYGDERAMALDFAAAVNEEVNDLFAAGADVVQLVVWGMVDNADAAVETPEVVAGCIRAALEHIEPERLLPSPDCGMKYLARRVAFAKLEALVAGTQIVRRELGADAR